MNFIALTTLDGAVVIIRAESVAFFKAEREEPITSMIYFNDPNMLPLSVRETISEIAKIIENKRSKIEENKAVVPPSVFNKQDETYFPPLPDSTKVLTYGSVNEIMPEEDPYDYKKNKIIHHLIFLIQNELKGVREIIGDDREYPKDGGYWIPRMLGQEEALVSVIRFLDKELNK